MVVSTYYKLVADDSSEYEIFTAQFNTIAEVKQFMKRFCEGDSSTPFASSRRIRLYKIEGVWDMAEGHLTFNTTLVNLDS